MKVFNMNILAVVIFNVTNIPKLRYAIDNDVLLFVTIEIRWPAIRTPQTFFIVLLHLFNESF